MNKLADKIVNQRCTVVGIYGSAWPRLCHVQRAREGRGLWKSKLLLRWQISYNPLSWIPKFGP